MVGTFLTTGFEDVSLNCVIGSVRGVLLQVHEALLDHPGPDRHPETYHPYSLQGGHSFPPHLHPTPLETRASIPPTQRWLQGVPGAGTSHPWGHTGEEAWSLQDPPPRSRQSRQMDVESYLHPQADPPSASVPRHPLAQEEEAGEDDLLHPLWLHGVLVQIILPLLCRHQWPQPLPAPPQVQQVPQEAVPSHPHCAPAPHLVPLWGAPSPLPLRQQPPWRHPQLPRTRDLIPCCFLPPDPETLSSSHLPKFFSSWLPWTTFHHPLLPHWCPSHLPGRPSMETEHWVSASKGSPEELEPSQRLLWESSSFGYHIQRPHHQGWGVVPGTGPCCWGSPEEVQAGEEIWSEECVLNLF